MKSGNDDLRFNDGKCDRHGNLFFGSISLTRKPVGGLYRLSSAGQLSQVADGITVSNGMCWDDERSLYYYVDSWQQRIDVFDCDPRTGDLSGRRPFAHIAPETGLPDGMAIDDEGGVWVVMFFRGAVHRYDVDGRLSEVVPIPVTCPTSVAFGGPGLRTLFITSSRHRLGQLEREEQPPGRRGVLVRAGCRRPSRARLSVTRHGPPLRRPGGGRSDLHAQKRS